MVYVDNGGGEGDGGVYSIFFSCSFCRIRRMRIDKCLAISSENCKLFLPFNENVNVFYFL